MNIDLDKIASNLERTGKMISDVGVKLTVMTIAVVAAIFFTVIGGVVGLAIGLVIIAWATSKL